MDIKLKDSFKLVSFNVTLVTKCKRCYTVAIKLKDLCYLKTDEMKALDYRLKATSAFCFFVKSLCIGELKKIMKFIAHEGRTIKNKSENWFIGNNGFIVGANPRSLPKGERP